MGLDSVELVMRVEETFGISIPDAEASQIVTIGDLYKSILPRLREDRSTKCLTARAFYRLRQALVCEGEVARSAIRPNTPLEEILPRPLRRGLWPRLGRHLGLELPRLCRPAWLAMGLATVVVLGIGWGYLAMRVWHVPPAGWLFVMSVAAIVLAIMTTRPFATEPSGCRTVGDLAKATLRDNFGTISTELATVNEKEVWESLLGLISDQLGVRQEKLNAETRFVKDLHID